MSKRLSREETAELIKGMKGRIAVTTHKNPDGDAVGSSLGWFNFLKKLGKEVKVVYKDPIPYFFDFLPGVEKVEVVGEPEVKEEFDWLIITDVSDPKRTGFESINAKKSLVIDHHITAEPFTDYAIVEPEISSTCELSYHIMKLIEPEAIDYSVALPIYTGIVTDTGSFGYSNTSPETHFVAAELMRKGVDPYFVIKNLFERNRINRFKLLELVLKTLSFALNNRVAHITLYQKFLKETGAYPEEAEGFISYPRSIAGVEVAVFFKEIEEGSWKVSLRSKGKVDVAQVAKKFGGGGHKMAAGYEVKGELKEIQEALFKELALSFEEAEFKELSS
ncbi:DHH family phosphoesterase [Thermovibrio ammonificans]|jgi:phosphoesterase RecJ-like protein|uniref:Phosphoesterase RecJ domain protein n=1 Tax=Thermovibrio ammonificans (strain DSM 15698 / JCM 12110 / HB-1) TaxID=648996 RepID=E8T6F3_THEA1|nr:bifunctional oligoribonuclease/PAP phosphatase NrnA [Thermovibrio ammonificans]ADU96737.1 phosphoesterase RecJ domain protein [Thermovibrio ammonificans HB-1]